MKESGITKEGRKVVSRWVVECQAEVLAMKGALYEAEQTLNKAYAADTCDHPEDNLKVMGGIELTETRCSKCGFSWFD